MKGNLVKLAVVGIVLAISGRIFWTSCIYDHGTAKSIPEMAKIYKKAGVLISATYTNSLVQEFPFDGKIDWQLQFIAEPLLILNGNINSNGFHSMILKNQSTRFFWTGIDKDGKEISPDGNFSTEAESREVVWRQMFFKATQKVQGYEACIEGSVDFASGVAVLKTY